MMEGPGEIPVTSYIGSVVGLVETLKYYKLEAESIFREAGLELTEVRDKRERVQLAAISRVLSIAAERSADPCFGLRFAENIHPTTYHAFGITLVSSTTLRAFCERLQRYYAFVCTGDRVLFEETEHYGRLQLIPPDSFDTEEEASAQVSAWAATWVKMVRMVYKPDYSPMKVQLTCGCPEEARKEFLEYFGSPVVFESDCNALWFDPTDLDLPLPGGNAELARHSEKMVFDYLQDLGLVDTANQVRIKLFELLPKGTFSIDVVARELNLSEAELVGQLKKAGTSHNQLLERSRRELAEEYILNKNLTVNEIAYTVGFSDCSNFARSFKRWTGMSPTEYRENPPR